ncbi:Uncharacterized protein ABC855_g910 [[Candida] zeylanoides]
MDRMVPVLTIPESAFEAAGYSALGRRSRLLTYLVRLTHASAAALTVAYVLAALVVKPLLELTAARRLQVLDRFRVRLRDCYLSLVGRVSHIPIVAINRDGKLYADAICQTPSSRAGVQPAAAERDGLVQSLHRLQSSLDQCTAYSVSEIPHYKTVRYCVQDFQTRADTDFFSTQAMFTTAVEGANGPRKKNIAVDIRNDIRGIKGMYISGKV